MNGYKIVLLKAILCFIGCRKVNGYAPEYVPLPEMKEKVDEYIKLLKENFTPYPEDYHNEIKHKHDETK